MTKDLFFGDELKEFAIARLLQLDKIYPEDIEAYCNRRVVKDRRITSIRPRVERRVIERRRCYA